MFISQFSVKCNAMIYECNTKNLIAYREKIKLYKYKFYKSTKNFKNYTQLAINKALFSLNKALRLVIRSMMFTTKTDCFKCCIRSHEFAAVNFLACIGANKCYRNEINSMVYTCARGFSAAGCGRRHRSSSDIRQLESMPGRVRAETQWTRTRILM